MSDIKVCRIGDLVKNWSPRGGSTHVQIDDKDGATMAAGTVYFKDCDIPFTLWYDEVWICHSVEGSCSIEVDGKDNFLNPGDMIWLPKDTPLRYKSVGTTCGFFVVTPPNWAELKPKA
ncbi:AraC family ligand binding domain-containing protein [Xinfangfangia sp. CPCC 101601]|uniref:AraC family ligand binding domain-containing protein n=1 Tax=Pseudogemmobacter lacusdianii TaxID=3069608 RepID=A0ABU0W341_9RHOB|nr:AraC family ligand binding domain-containing protein [Xinfangfangia sp. CPCC 101601]MDQ2068203.1 AraC family ligand binding domain-containing protein [Xinfangfangia sp. CPCC 101601]